METQLAFLVIEMYSEAYRMKTFVEMADFVYSS